MTIEKFEKKKKKKIENWVIPNEGTRIQCTKRQKNITFNLVNTKADVCFHSKNHLDATRAIVFHTNKNYSHFLMILLLSIHCMQKVKDVKSHQWPQHCSSGAPAKMTSQFCRCWLVGQQTARIQNFVTVSCGSFCFLWFVNTSEPPPPNTDCFAIQFLKSNKRNKAQAKSTLQAIMTFKMQKQGRWQRTQAFFLFLSLFVVFSQTLTFVSHNLQLANLTLASISCLITWGSGHMTKAEQARLSLGGTVCTAAARDDGKGAGCRTVKRRTLTQTRILDWINSNKSAYQRIGWQRRNKACLPRSAA